MKLLLRTASGLALAWALLACGDDVGLGLKRLDSAGGDVESADGDAIVRVPPGALRGPTVIEIERLEPDLVPGVLGARDVVSSVYRFGPEGLRFEAPVRIEIYFDADLLPAEVELEDLTLGKVTTSRQLEELTEQEIIVPQEGRVQLHARRRGIGGQVSSFSPFAVWVDDPEEPTAVTSFGFPTAVSNGR